MAFEKFFPYSFANGVPYIGDLDPSMIDLCPCILMTIETLVWEPLRVMEVVQ